MLDPSHLIAILANCLGGSCFFLEWRDDAIPQDDDLC
jgi:hypothetical protein